MRKTNSFAALISFLTLGVGAVLILAVTGGESNAQSLWISAVTVIIALIASSAIKIADQWERVVILRLGRFRSLAGPDCSSSSPSSRPSLTGSTRA